MATKHISVICYDLHAVSRFFRSVALAMALQRNTSLQWQTYEDSAVLNAAYWMLFWKDAPGTAEIKTGTKVAMEKDTDDLHLKFLMAWLEKLFTKGPAAGNKYVEEMTERRNEARVMLNDLFHSASQINEDVVHETRDAIIFLTKVRLAASVGVALIGGAVGVAVVGSGAGATISLLGINAGASAGAFGVTSLGYSVTTSLVKSWEEGAKASVAAVMIEGSKYAVSEGLGKGAEHRLQQALAKQGKSQQILQSAKKQIQKYGQLLASQQQAEQARAARGLGRSIGRASVEASNIQKASQAARMAATAARSVPVIFAALDIWGAIGDYQDTMAGQQVP